MPEELNELFYRDTYCREFDSEVTQCVKGKKYWEIVLEDTAFYPEGGGQPADHGTLNDIEVMDVHRRNGVIIHYCTEALEAGSTVHGIIDWNRRFDHMQQHSGEHIVSGIIHQRYGYENVGFHMGDVIQIDFNGELTNEDLHWIEREANTRIWRNIPIEITYPSEEELKNMWYRSKKELEGKIRIVTVDDSDICACCGTHVQRTGEIGIIHLISVEKHKDGSRIEMLAGQRAWQWLRTAADQNTEISHLFSAKPLETAGAVKKYMNQSTETNHKLSRLRKEYIAMKADMLEKTDTQILIENDLDADAARMLANNLLENNKADTVAVLSEITENTCRYLVMSRTVDLKSTGAEMRKRLTVKGGGSAVMQQGMIENKTGEVKAVLEELLHR